MHLQANNIHSGRSGRPAVCLSGWSSLQIAATADLHLRTAAGWLAVSASLVRLAAAHLGLADGPAGRQFGLAAKVVTVVQHLLAAELMSVAEILHFVAGWYCLRQIAEIDRSEPTSLAALKAVVTMIVAG